MDTIYGIFGIANDAIAAILRGFLPDWVVAAVTALLAIAAVLVVMIVIVMSQTLAERRVIGKMQDRRGPNRVGKFGSLQPVADVLKLLLKEDIRPTVADPAVHFLAPVITLIPALLIYAVVPFGQGLQIADVNIGLLYIVAIGALPTIGIVVAGWGSGNKYSVLGAMRAAAQMISFEVPLVLALISPVLIVGSLSLVDVVKAQSALPLLVLQPVAFVVYLVAGIAEVNRTPFDMPESESELGAGFWTEYSGMKFALFYLAEYLNAFALSAVATTVFLSGWQGPILPPYIWFIVKSYLLFVGLIWIRATMPRLRVDQLMGFCWKVLVPVALANLVVTGIGVSVYHMIAG